MLLPVRMQIKNIITYFKKPYELLNDNRIKFIYSFGASLFILAFLWLFGPFGIVLFRDEVKLKFLTLICLSGIVIVSFHIYFLQNIIIRKHTIGSTGIWLLWIHLVIALSNTVIYFLIFNHGIILWQGFPRMFYQTLLVGLIPVLFLLFLYNSYYLKKKIKIINQVNFDLTQYKSTITAETDITLTSSNLREVITLNPGSLLYITSASNYVEIYWISKGQVQRSLLRNTLTDIEKEITSQCTYIERCHSSFIVNINQIQSIAGNSGGYKIILNNIDSQIPVSKKYKDNFFKRLHK